MRRVLRGPPSRHNGMARAARVDCPLVGRRDAVAGRGRGGGALRDDACAARGRYGMARAARGLSPRVASSRGGGARQRWPERYGMTRARRVGVTAWRVRRVDCPLLGVATRRRGEAEVAGALRHGACGAWTVPYSASRVRGAPNGGGRKTVAGRLRLVVRGVSVPSVRGRFRARTSLTVSFPRLQARLPGPCAWQTSGPLHGRGLEGRCWVVWLRAPRCRPSARGQSEARGCALSGARRVAVARESLGGFPLGSFLRL